MFAITRFGHAALLVEAASTRVLIDPGAYCRPEVFELRDLDAIVVTHQHPDHLDQSDAGRSLIEANPQALLICDPETSGLVPFGAWTVNGDGACWQVGELSITGVGSQHAVISPEIPRVSNVGVLVSDGTTTLFHPGDSYDSNPSGVTALAVPLSAPWAKVSETVDFVQRVGANTVFPIHDCTISDLGYSIYWSRVVELGGTEDARLLGQDGSTRL